jgi:GNAT superfamily N-acetyltransferase
MRDLEARIRSLVEKTTDEIAGIIAGSPDVSPDEVVEFIEKGGEGSGHFGHEGRPGEVGGSKPSGTAEAVRPRRGGPSSERGRRLHEVSNRIKDNYSEFNRSDWKEINKEFIEGGVSYFLDRDVKVVEEEIDTISHAIGLRVYDGNNFLTLQYNEMFDQSEYANEMILSWISADVTGTGLGSAFMKTAKYYADTTGMPFRVVMVTNPDFYDRFSWLQRVRARYPAEYIYKPDTPNITMEQYSLPSRESGDDPDEYDLTISPHHPDGKSWKPGDPMTVRGGEGSGHFGHEGRPGKVGGSQPSDAIASLDVSDIVIHGMGKTVAESVTPHDLSQRKWTKFWISPDGDIWAFPNDWTHHAIAAESISRIKDYLPQDIRDKFSDPGMFAVPYADTLFQLGFVRGQYISSGKKEIILAFGPNTPPRAILRTIEDIFSISPESDFKTNWAVLGQHNEWGRVPVIASARNSDDRAGLRARFGMVERGGPGSGHFGHAGRPGKVGGSQPNVTGEADEIKHRPMNRNVGIMEGLISAWVDGDQVGSLAFGLPTRSSLIDKGYDLELGWVNVREPFRGRGIATQMMDRFWQEYGDQRIAPFETTPEGRAFMKKYFDDREIAYETAGNMMWRVQDTEPVKVQDTEPFEVEGGWWQDNPQTEGYDWQASENQMTAGYRAARVDPRDLVKLPGARGEQNNIDRERVSELAESIRAEGLRHPPLIIVEQDGTAHIWEGNHRIRAAIEAGLDTITVEVRYFGGSEEKTGVWKPRLVQRGGPGSGHFGHEGRPGEVGGSQPSGGPHDEDVDAEADTLAKIHQAEYETTRREWEQELLDQYGEADWESGIWIGPSGKFLAPLEDHQQTALDLLGWDDDMMTREGTERGAEATRIVVSGGLVRYNYYEMEADFDIPNIYDTTDSQWASMAAVVTRLNRSIRMEYGENARAEVNISIGSGVGRVDVEEVISGRDAYEWLGLEEEYDYGVYRGGQGSGHFGHAGRPGEVGGSQPSGDVSLRDLKKKWIAQIDESLAETEVQPYEVWGDFFISPSGAIYHQHESTSGMGSSMWGNHALLARKGVKNLDTEEIFHSLHEENPRLEFDNAQEIMMTGLGYIRGWALDKDELNIQISHQPSRKQMRVIRDIWLATPYIALNWELDYDPHEYADGRTSEYERFEREVEIRRTIYRGGPGSGHFGHEGRPGEVGGSQPSGAADYDGEFRPRVGEYAHWDDGDYLVKIERDNGDGTYNVTVMSGPDRFASYDNAYADDLYEPDEDEVDLWTAKGADVTIDRAIESFGLTEYKEEAGYILPDGSMLDFSGSNIGGGGGRALDHRDIGRILLDDEPGGTEGMVYFMDLTGAVRMSYSGGDLMIDFAQMPTRRQKERLESLSFEVEYIYWDRTFWNSDTQEYTTPASGELEGSDPEALAQMYRDLKSAELGRERSWLDRAWENFKERVLSNLIDRGGQGSGHFGHEGRPGEVGGSKPSGIKGSRDIFIGVPADIVEPGTRTIDMHDFKQQSGAPIRGNTVISVDDPRIPDRVYHMTTNLPGILESGEISARGKGGLGGDKYDQIVSLTISEDVARLLAHDMRTYVTIVQEFSATEPQWVPWDEREAIGGAVHVDRNTGEPWTKEQYREWASGLLNRLNELDQSVTGDWEYSWDFDYHDPSYGISDWIRQYYVSRSHNAHIKNPIFMGESADYLNYDPSLIGVVSIPRENLDTGALLVDFDLDNQYGLQEVRLYGDVPLDNAEVIDGELVERGGLGSGHFGHKGRPGEVGGSQPSGRQREDIQKSITSKFENMLDVIGERKEIWETPRTGSLWISPTGKYYEVGSSHQTALRLAHQRIQFSDDEMAELNNWSLNQYGQEYVADYNYYYFLRELKWVRVSAELEGVSVPYKSRLNLDFLPPIGRATARTLRELVLFYEDKYNNEPRFHQVGGDSGEGTDELFARIGVTRGGPGSGHFGHEGRPGEVGGSLPSGAAAAEIGGGTVAERLERLRSLGVRIGATTVDEMIDVQAQNYEQDHGWDEDHTPEQFYENWRSKYDYDAVASEAFQEYVIEGLESAIAQGIVDPSELMIVIRKPDPSSHGEDSLTAEHSGVIFIYEHEFIETPELMEWSVNHFNESHIPPPEWGSGNPDDWPSTTSQAFDHNYAGIVAHEVGHSKQTWRGENSPYRRAQLYLSDENRWDIKRWVSSYAVTSANEFEAECFALSRHPDFDQFPEQTRRIVNYVIYGEEL